jgi:ketosteroid isomerase-like protein
MSRENVEVVRQVYEAWNRGDLEWLLDHTTPDFEFRTVRLFPDLEPVYRGHEGFRHFWETFREPWESFVIEVERIDPAGDDRVVALFRFHGRGRDGVDVKLEYAQLFTLGGEMATKVVGFATWHDALEAARLSEQAIAAGTPEVPRGVPN